MKKLGSHNQWKTVEKYKMQKDKKIQNTEKKIQKKNTENTENSNGE